MQEIFPRPNWRLNFAFLRQSHKEFSSSYFTAHKKSNPLQVHDVIHENRNYKVHGSVFMTGFGWKDSLGSWSCHFVSRLAYRELGPQEVEFKETERIV
jgi:hypothetical protein